MPEVEYACNHSSEWRTFGVDDKKMKLPGNFAGADFFKIFSYPLLHGSKDNSIEHTRKYSHLAKNGNRFFWKPGTGHRQISPV